MLFIRSSSSAEVTSKVSACNLAFCWTLFLTTGVWAGELSAPSALITLSHLPNATASFVTLILFHLIILIASLISLQIGMRWVLLLLVGVRSMSYGFLLGCIYASFGSAGWLYCFLFYFANSICVVIELWFWSIASNTKGRVLFIYALFAFALELVAIFTDSFIFSLFTSELIY